MAYIKSTFSEYGHIAYVFKGNEAYNNMLANILPLHLLLTPGVRSKGHFFLKVVMLHIKTGMKHSIPCKQMLCPFTHPRLLDGIKTRFPEEGYLAYERSVEHCATKMFELMHTFDLLGYTNKMDLNDGERALLFSVCNAELLHTRNMALRIMH